MPADTWPTRLKALCSLLWPKLHSCQLYVSLFLLLQGQAVEQVKVSVRTVVKRHMVPGNNAVRQGETVVSHSTFSMLYLQVHFCTHMPSVAS